MMDLQVTVASDCADAKRRDGKPVDIAELLSHVPTAKIVDGEPRVSVRVQVHERHHGLLLESVKDFCVVDPFGYLDLYEDRREGWSDIGYDLI